MIGKLERNSVDLKELLSSCFVKMKRRSFDACLKIRFIV